MAVQDIVLGGFGSTGSVSLIVTHGFESYVGEPPSEWQEDVQNIVLGGFGNLGSVSLIVTSGFYSASGAVAVGGYDYKLRIKRHRVIIDGKRYFLTPQEEADLLNSLIARLEREKDRIEAPKRVDAKRSRPPKRIREEAKRIDEKIDRYKIHLALLRDRELELDSSIRARLLAIQQLEEEEALAFILALA